MSAFLSFSFLLVFICRDPLAWLLLLDCSLFVPTLFFFVGWDGWPAAQPSREARGPGVGCLISEGIPCEIMLVWFFLYCLNRCTRLLDEYEREGRKHGCSGRVEHWAGLRTLIEDTPTGFLPFYPLRLYSIYKKGRRASYTAQGKQ